MYEAFFGLNERPFDLTVDPRFLFRAAAHREALSNLQYGISGQKGITVLLGDAGTGKTTLIHLALQMLHERNGHAVYLNNPTLTRAEFYEFLANGFGLTSQAALSKTRFLHELTTLLSERRRNGSANAFVVDEAQSLPDELLEEVRLLANIETNTDKLLSVVLAGQPELGERLNRPSLRQLKQRIALRCVLLPLNLRETAAYIAKRISIAGGDSARIFTREAVEAVYAHSRGVPRTISVICDNSLVSAFALDRRLVDADIVLDVCRDFDFAPPTTRPRTELAEDAEPAPAFRGGEPRREFGPPHGEPEAERAARTEQVDAPEDGTLAGTAKPGVGPSDFLTLVRRRRRFSFF
ncbi:MAG: AAA family ATPase [Vicinamibacterales bacterium]